jgi:hypothetical protein
MLKDSECIEELYLPRHWNDVSKLFECDKLHYDGNSLEDIVALNQHKYIYSTNGCSKEVVDANHTLVGGHFQIRGMYRDHLQKVFQRNQRPIKSARNI